MIQRILFCVVFSTALSFSFGDRLIEIGTVNGKIYHAEITVLLRWPHAQAYCEKYGLKLATIETQEEVDFLNEAFNAEFFSSHMWTSGRDSRLAREFTWDTSDNEVTQLLEIDNAITAYSDCLAYLSQAETSYMRIASCSTSLGILCQSQ